MPRPCRSSGVPNPLAILLMLSLACGLTLGRCRAWNCVSKLRSVLVLYMFPALLHVLRLYEVGRHTPRATAKVPVP